MSSDPSAFLDVDPHPEKLLELLVFGPGSIEILTGVRLALLARDHVSDLGGSEDSIELFARKGGYADHPRRWPDFPKLKIPKPTPRRVVPDQDLLVTVTTLSCDHPLVLGSVIGKAHEFALATLAKAHHALINSDWL